MKRNFGLGFRENENIFDIGLLKEEILYYEKNLKFLKDVYEKVRLADSRTSDFIKENSNEYLLKRINLFEIENSLERKKASFSPLDSFDYCYNSGNKPEHLIWRFMNSFTKRINKRMLLNLMNSNYYNANGNNSPLRKFDRLDKNIFRNLIINNQKKELVTLLQKIKLI